MLDIKLIRENPGRVRSNLMKRGTPENLSMLDERVETDRKWRENLTKLNEPRHKKKLVTTEVATLKKAGKDATETLAKTKTIDVEITNTEKEVAAEEEKEHDLLMRLPNMLHDSVPVGQGENENQQVRTWGNIPTFKFPVKNHMDLALNLDIVDIERAGKVAGSRFHYLKREAVLLDMALLSFAMEEMVTKGYTPIEPPYLMRKDAYEGVTALSDFADVLYKIENEDLYLIATSEHPMAAMPQNEALTEQQLPLKLAGISACFRKEAGAHGQDERRIVRP